MARSGASSRKTSGETNRPARDVSDNASMHRATAGVRVLGIDPGLNVTGYGALAASPRGPVLLEAGIVRSRPRGSLESRLQEIFDGIRDAIQSLRPSVLAIEQLYSHYERPRTAILMGHARGVICLAASQEGVPVVHYAATQVKKTLTGSGRASKGQVQRAICRELGLAQEPEPPDVADALAVALCHYYSSGGSAERETASRKMRGVAARRTA
jgi:crossover junction endodeoxyribonuclease RuvC